MKTCYGKDWIHLDRFTCSCKHHARFLEAIHAFFFIRRYTNLAFSAREYRIIALIPLREIYTHHWTQCLSAEFICIFSTWKTLGICVMINKMHGVIWMYTFVTIPFYCSQSICNKTMHRFENSPDWSVPTILCLWLLCRHDVPMVT